MQLRVREGGLKHVDCLGWSNSRDCNSWVLSFFHLLPSCRETRGVHLLFFPRDGPSRAPWFIPSEKSGERQRARLITGETGRNVAKRSRPNDPDPTGHVLN